MKTLILCDFDGTVTIRDMGCMLLNRFSSGAWESVSREFRIVFRVFKRSSTTSRKELAGVDVYALPTGFHSRKELSAAQPKRILRSLGELVKLINCVTCKAS
jgi:hypothetical protein